MYRSARYASVAMTGTPRNIPITPKNFPPIVIAKMIHRGFMPVEEPISFGPSTSPSNCCRARIMIVKTNALIGEIHRMMMIPGIAPINGPKYGIIFVTPTITEMSST